MFTDWQWADRDLVHVYLVRHQGPNCIYIGQLPRMVGAD